jgi:hypothetical protein
MSFRIRLLALALPALFIAPAAEAAQLLLTPPQGQFRPGDTVAVDLRLDNQNECVNAGEVTVGYPKDLVEVIDVSRGNSIFTIWVVPPTVRSDYGLINFIGGIPGGYCGRTPGDPAVTNVLARFIFRFSDKIKNTVPVQVPITISPSSRVTLNNGQGTEAKLSVRSASFTITATAPAQENEWTKALRDDKTPPEEFQVGVYQDKNIFDNRFFAAWSAVDKQTGLDHYELAEIPAGRSQDAAKWKRADSPFVLADQSAKSTVLVKAFDKSGNVRLAQYAPKAAPKRTVDGMIWWTLASLLVIALAALRYFRFFP